MTNHLHALIQIGERPLGHLVKSIAVRYSRYRHGILGTSGHLFERRHGASLIGGDVHFLAVLRYIHLNPVEAYMVSDPGEYPWSSHRAYLGSEPIAWVTTGVGLSLFGPDLRCARRAYARFIDRGEDDPDTKLHADDRRVCGGDRVVMTLPMPVPGPQDQPSLRDLAACVCADHGISVELFRSRSPRRDLTPIRLELAERALERRIASLSDVARYLGRHPSTLSKQMSRYVRKRPKRSI